MIPRIDIKNATKEEALQISQNYAQWCKDVYGEDITKDKKLESIRSLEEMRAYSEHLQQRFGAFAKAAMLEYWQHAVIADKIKQTMKASRKKGGVPLHG